MTGSGTCGGIVEEECVQSRSIETMLCAGRRDAGSIMQAKLASQPVISRVARLLCGAAVGGVAVIAALTWHLPLSQAALTKVVTVSPFLFHRGFEDWAEDRGIAEKVLGRAMLLKVEHDLVAHIAERLDEVDDDVDFILATLDLVRGAFVTQRDINLMPHQLSTSAVFMFGAGTCDQVNGVLARILATRLSVELFSLFDADNTYSPHTLVRIHTDEGDLFADAWGDSSLFMLADEMPAEWRGRVLGADVALRTLGDIVPNADWPAFADGFVLNRYDLPYRAAKAWGLLVDWAFQEDESPGSIGTAAAMPLPTGTADSNGEIVYPDIEERRAYLGARVAHLLGDESSAFNVYRGIAGTCTSPMCRASDLFAERMQMRWRAA